MDDVLGDIEFPTAASSSVSANVSSSSSASAAGASSSAVEERERTVDDGRETASYQAGSSSRSVGRGGGGGHSGGGRSGGGRSEYVDHGSRGSSHRRGRGEDSSSAGGSGSFHSLEGGKGGRGGGGGSGGPQKSIEGWVLFVRGIHPEAQEDDIRDKFLDYGPLSSVILNMDRRNGCTKPWALVEYKKRSEAEEAIKELHGGKMLGQKIEVDWAFMR